MAGLNGLLDRENGEGAKSVRYGDGLVHPTQSLSIRDELRPNTEFSPGNATALTPFIHKPRRIMKKIKITIETITEIASRANKR